MVTSRVEWNVTSQSPVCVLLCSLAGTWLHNCVNPCESPLPPPAFRAVGLFLPSTHKRVEKPQKAKCHKDK